MAVFSFVVLNEFVVASGNFLGAKGARVINLEQTIPLLSQLHQTFIKVVLLAKELCVVVEWDTICDVA
jgi:hypothetical protein